MKSANVFVLSAAVLLIILSCNNRHETAKPGPLPRSTPGAENVNPKLIISFLDTISAGKHEMHSLIILRHGKVVAEGWWAPYNAELPNTLYSTSKSFTSTAVGFAVSENLLSVNDTVISFFKESLPDTISDNLASLTVKDLLTMSAGQDPDPTFSINSSDTNWIKTFLSKPMENKPGTRFLYNSMASYMLSAIVQKVTGQKILDYLTPRLFEPLGITGADWETDPEGINTGGWGLRIKTEDMAKFGQLYLQKGVWQGKQLIPAPWIEEATTFKIDQAPDASQQSRDSSDWKQGYCYQFWRCRNNAYRADGAYGQYIIVIPDKDAVIAITSETPDMQGELNLVWKYLLPALSDQPLTADTKAEKDLKDCLSSLALPEIAGKANVTKQSELSGKTCVFPQNSAGIDSVRFDFSDTTCSMTILNKQHSYTLSFSNNSWQTGVSEKPGPRLIAIGHGPHEFKTAGNFAWKDDRTLQLVIRYPESPHRETYLFRFDDKRTIMNYSPSIPFEWKPSGIIGKVVK